MITIPRICACILVFLSLVFTINVQAVTLREVKADKETYVYGEGQGATEEEADRIALDDLLSKISTYVVSNISHTSKETTNNGVLTSNNEFESMIKTYRSGQIYNTEKEVSGKNLM